MKDVALESMLDRLSHLTVERERVNWISNGLAAYEEYHKTQTAYFNHLDRYSSALRISHRVLRLPVKNLVCPICTKRILWEVDLGAGKLVYQLLSSTEDLPETVNPIGVFLQLIGSSLLPGHPGSRWEYRLAIVDPNEHIKWKQIEKVSSH